MTLGDFQDIHDSETPKLHHKKYLSDQHYLQLPVNVLIEGESYHINLSTLPYLVSPDLFSQTKDGLMQTCD